MPIDLKGFHVFAAIVVVVAVVVVKHYAYQDVGILCFCHKMMQSCCNTLLPVDRVQCFRARNKKHIHNFRQSPTINGPFFIRLPMYTVESNHPKLGHRKLNSFRTIVCSLSNGETE